MAKVVRKNSELLDLVRFLNSTPVDKGSRTEVKFKKIADKIKPAFDSYNEKREEIRVDNAYADSNGILDMNEKGDYKFTKSAIKNMAKEMKLLLDETFEFYELTFSTDGISDFKNLSGWVAGIEPEKQVDDE